jgi:hypothetical protein
MTGPFVPVGILNLIRAVVGIPHHRFNLFVKCSSPRARGAPPRGLHRSAEWRGDKLSDGGHGADPNRQVRSDAPEHACRGGHCSKHCRRRPCAGRPAPAESLGLFACARRANPVAGAWQCSEIGPTSRSASPGIVLPRAAQRGHPAEFAIGNFTADRLPARWPRTPNRTRMYG